MIPWGGSILHDYHDHAHPELSETHRHQSSHSLWIILKCCYNWWSYSSNRCRARLWRCVPWATGGVSREMGRVSLGDDDSAPRWCQIFPGECISVYKLCRGRCVTSAEAGFSEGYSWCPESQQCIPPGVKCAVMWGVGCGKSSFFCWRGNVCLPKSLPCNGNKDWQKLLEKRVLMFRILYKILPAVRFLQLSVWPWACDSPASDWGQEKLRDSGAHPYHLASFTRHSLRCGHQVLFI